MALGGRTCVFKLDHRKGIGISDLVPDAGAIGLPEEEESGLRAGDLESRGLERPRRVEAVDAA